MSIFRRLPTQHHRLAVVFQTLLAAADGDDNLQLVAIGQQALVKLSARDDFAVAFHGNALAAQLHLIEQCGNIDRGIEVARHPIDRN